MTNLDSILKSRDITLPTKVCLVKVMVFLVITYGCESWTIKKAEHRRTDAFELWCWRRLLRVPWTARRSNQSILKEISPGCSLEGLMLKLIPILWPPDVKNCLIWKDPDAEKDWRREEKGMAEDEMVGWHHWLDGREWVNSGSWWWTGKPGVLQSLGSQRVGQDWVIELTRVLTHLMTSSAFLQMIDFSDSSMVSFSFQAKTLIALNDFLGLVQPCPSWVSLVPYPPASLPGAPHAQLYQGLYFPPYSVLLFSCSPSKRRALLPSVVKCISWHPLLAYTSTLHSFCKYWVSIMYQMLFQVYSSEQDPLASYCSILNHLVGLAVCTLYIMIFMLVLFFLSH